MKRSVDVSAAQDVAALRAALLVREHLGFRRASEVLGVNASVLSRRVLALEDALGVSLFQRTAGGARTTGAGERFLAAVQQAFEVLARAAVRAGAEGRGEVGRLRLGHVWPVTTGPGETVLRSYREVAREVEVELRTGSAAELVAAVLDRDLDAALVDMEAPASGLAALPLWREPWFWARAEDSGEEAWGVAPILCAVADDCARIRSLAAAGGGVRAGVRVQMTTHDGVLGLVSTGAGHALVPRSVADATRARVMFAAAPGRPAPLCVSVVWRDDHDNPALRRFISLLRTLDLDASGVVSRLRAVGDSR